ATAHERIAWSGYSFPRALPGSTFDVAHAHVVEPPIRTTAPAGAEAVEPN
ncbi:MAG: hypothetical protein IAI48_07830, partial [Candidatus Eremiobacteraeota bacterium]|nr:hypothetical protein [Candidatus Eremiobacteraeota bacterium]